MSEFKYKVSVIVPVYNVEQYLRGCLDSLLAQTIDHDQMEVLLINDGSTDNSLGICEEYAELFPMFKVFSQENAGVSAARNTGIRNAKGKYILYLDSDDSISNITLKNVVEFFDDHYDEVDVVTYYDKCYLNGKALAENIRYKYLTKTGVYDLQNNNFAFQLRLPICHKNKFKDNIFFLEDMKFQEDQQFCCELLKDKLKVGYVKEAVYNYLRNTEGLVSSASAPLYSFDASMTFFEKLFYQYKDAVPRYFQSIFMHDISWKLLSYSLFPYHYDGEEYTAAVSRISRLLDRVDDDIIMTCPTTDTFHRHFFLNMKSNAGSAVVTALKDNISIYKNSYKIYTANKFEIILNKISINGNKLQMLAYLKSPIFNYIEPPLIQAVITKADDSVERVNLDFFLSSWSWYKTREKTNNFFGFYVDCSADTVRSFKIQILVDGICYDTYYWFMPTAPYSSNINQYNAILGDYAIEFNKNVFYVSELNRNERLMLRKKATEKLKNRLSLYGIRNEADAMMDKKIWLYYDCAGVEKDNGYYQFIHDAEMDDGIERFYINANDELSPDLFGDKHKRKVVQFGSIKHKILYVAASKIITAYIEDNNINPFSKSETEYVADILNFEIIYLQHGILHAHLPWKYSPGRINCDKVVISSCFEKENFTKTYNFPVETLIACGMPRFDHIDKNAAPGNRILFAPSWRNYLIGAAVGNKWTLTEGKFLKSDYYRVFNDFLNSPELERILEENDIYMDFKIHPIFKPYLELFENNNERVNFADSSVKDEEYAAFITDFSSFVFDFAYLKRPIMYFVPDYLEFKSGMNSYRELDLPFEKAFGSLVTDADSAVAELLRIIENGMVPDQVFRDRMENFYLPLENCTEKLYEYLSKGTIS